MTEANYGQYYGYPCSDLFLPVAISGAYGPAKYMSKRRIEE